jgi:small conductance mechanosensitive channel
VGISVVNKIQLFTTIIKTLDNCKVIVPNNKLFGDKIINYTAEPQRRLDLVFGVGYQDDL